jgi:hypothetical protein
MRRIGLVAVIILLVVLGGVYTAGWFYAASRVADSLAEAAETLKAQNLELSWQGLHVGGYPFALRAELSQVSLRNAAGNVPAALHAPVLTAGIRPWNFRVVRLEAPQGLQAAAGPNGTPVATLAAKAMTGSVVARSEGGASIWLGLNDASAVFGLTYGARFTSIWLEVPPHPPQEHTDPALGLAVQARDLTLPLVPPPLKNPLDEVGFGVTLKGAFPPGPPRQAAQAWRDAGGTLELDNIAVRWGAVSASGSGTIALDQDMQPTGAFSGSLEGYDDVMHALVAAGRLRSSDARMAQLALSLLAKPGPGGRPQIASSFTVQNGQMYLGPAKLGPAPRIAW